MSTSPGCPYRINHCARCPLARAEKSSLQSNGEPNRTPGGTWYLPHPRTRWRASLRRLAGYRISCETALPVTASNAEGLIDPAEAWRREINRHFATRQELSLRTPGWDHQPGQSPRWRFIQVARKHFAVSEDLSGCRRNFFHQFSITVKADGATRPVVPIR